MSKYNNVNPGQYKVAGRTHPGDPLLQEYDRRRLTVAEHEAGTPRKRELALAEHEVRPSSGTRARRAVPAERPRPQNVGDFRTRGTKASAASSAAQGPEKRARESSRESPRSRRS